MSIVNGPVECRPRDDGPTYFLRLPQLAERARFHHAVASQGVKRWPLYELLAAVRRAVIALRDAGETEADFQGWLELLDAYAERVDRTAAAMRAGGGAEVREAFLAALAPPAEVEVIIGLARETALEVAKVIADNECFDLVAGTEAARLFLTGWAGEGLGDFKRGPGGATDRMLWQIAEFDLLAIGYKVRELLEPRPEQLGNSPPASSGSPSPASLVTPASIRPTDPAPAATAGA